MTITSVNFFVIVFLLSLIYRVIPGKFQWKYLLGISLVMYCLLAEPLTLLYIVGSATVVYVAALRIKNSRYHILPLVCALIVLFSVLIVTKYMTLPSIMAAMGVSYYTMSLIGYLLDVHWGVIPPEKSFFKVLLFSCYFPHLVSGPICRYEDMDKEFQQDHHITVDDYADACIRVLYGCFLKVVIAGRLTAYVSAIFRQYDSLNGLFIILGAVLFTIQLYCDFSGCMHMVLGVSQLFGVKLPENFRTPFFSKTVQEWWQRWHITLGGWTREYILYPVMKSKWIAFLRGRLQKFGKKTSKKVTTYTSMFLVWMYIGLWHGGTWKFFVMGIYFWLIICLESENILKTHKNIWGIIRTIILAAIGDLFFYCSSLKESLRVIASIFTNLLFSVRDSFTVLRNTEEINGYSFIILITCVLTAIGIELIEFRSGKVFIFWLRQRNWLLRWMFIYLIFFITLILGIYGEGYEAATFIYQGF